MSNSKQDHVQPHNNDQKESSSYVSLFGRKVNTASYCGGFMAKSFANI